MSEESNKKGQESPTAIDWKKIFVHYSLLSGVDVAIHAGYAKLWSSDDQDKVIDIDVQTTGETPEPIDLSSPYAATTKHLLYSAKARAIFLLVTFLVCHMKWIPKKIQPWFSYIVASVIYVFIVHLSYRFLADSELDIGIFYVSYLFLIVFDLTVNIAAFFLATQVAFDSGAIEKISKKEKKKKAQDEKETDKNGKETEKDEKSDGDEDKDEEEDEEEDDEDEDDDMDFNQINAERKVPLYKMVPKIASWYTRQAGWIGAGYFCMLILILSKLPLHMAYVLHFFFNISCNDQGMLDEWGMGMNGDEWGLNFTHSSEWG